MKPPRVRGQPAAQRAAGEQAGGLGRVRSPAPGPGRRRHRDTSDGCKASSTLNTTKAGQGHGETIETLAGHRQQRAHQRQAGHGCAQRAAMGAALFRHEHDRHHQHEGHQDDRQIDLPQFARVQPADLASSAGATTNSATCTRCSTNTPKFSRNRSGCSSTSRGRAACMARAWVRGTTGTTQRATAGKPRPDRRWSRTGPTAPPAHQHGRQHQRNGEGQADRATDHGHGAGAHLVAGGVGQPGGDGGGNGARALDGAADGDPERPTPGHRPRCRPRTTGGRRSPRAGGPSGRTPARRESA